MLVYLKNHSVPLEQRLQEKTINVGFLRIAFEKKITERCVAPWAFITAAFLNCCNKEARQKIGEDCSPYLEWKRQIGVCSRLSGTIILRIIENPLHLDEKLYILIISPKELSTFERFKFCSGIGLLTAVRVTRLVFQLNMVRELAITVDPVEVKCSAVDFLEKPEGREL
jgi:hypothetical protein